MIVMEEKTIVMEESVGLILASYFINFLVIFTTNSFTLLSFQNTF